MVTAAQIELKFHVKERYNWRTKKYWSLVATTLNDVVHWARNPSLKH